MSSLVLARRSGNCFQFQSESVADLKKRSGVERLIANLTRYHDARQARPRGTNKADFQAKQAGTAFNLREWLRQRRQRDQQAKSAKVMQDQPGVVESAAQGVMN